MSVSLERHEVISENDEYYKLDDCIEVTAFHYSREIPKSFINTSDTLAVLTILSCDIAAWFTFNEDRAVEIANNKRLFHIKECEDIIKSVEITIKNMKENPFTKRTEGDKDEKRKGRVESSGSETSL